MTSSDTSGKCTECLGMAIIVIMHQLRRDTTSEYSAARTPFRFSLVLYPSFFLSPLSTSFSFDRFSSISSIPFFALCFASLLFFVTDYVIFSRCYIHPALLASRHVCVFPVCAVFLRSRCPFNFVILLFLPIFSISIWTSFVWSCHVLVGILLMLSFWFRFLLCSLNPSFHPSTSTSPGFRADSST